MNPGAAPNQPGPPNPPQQGVRNSLSGSGSSGWRSEEDYVFAHLAVAMGVLSNQAVNETLQSQAHAASQGDPLSFTQIAIREGRLPPQAVIHVKAELAKSLRACLQCGQQRYLAAGHQPRVEPCPHCGGQIPVPAIQSSMSASSAARRQGAFQMTQGAQHFRGADPFNAKGAGPKLFGNFIIEGEIAKGGMGAIYKARHAGTGQIQALKVLLAGDRATKGQLHRFKREARAQIELDHPNVVKIHEAGEWEGILYYTMDLVEGRGDLSKYQDLEVSQRLALMAEVCRAMHYCHQAGYVHRDLKPGNILLGPSDRPLLTDFGLAKNIGGDTRLTKEGSALGTPYYMSPEQATGQLEKMGPKTDIWALGVLVYEMATGALPFMAETALELYRKICEDEPEPMTEHGLDDEFLQAIVWKAIEKDLGDRYATAEELAIDLERYLRGEPPLAELVSSATRMFRKVKKHRKSIKLVGGLAGGGGAVLVLVVLVFSLIFMSFSTQQALSQRREAMIGAASALSQALSEEDTDRAALDLALGDARELLDDDELPEELAEAGAKLHLEVARGLLAQGGLAMRARTASGASLALANAEQAQSSLSSRGADDEADDAELQLQALLLQAQAHHRLGSDSDADAALGKARALAPKDARVLLAEGLRLTGEAAAERLLSVTEGEGPPAPRIRAWAALGAVRLASDDVPGAEQAFAEGMELASDPRDVSMLRLLEANAWLAEGNFERSFAALTAGLDEAPSLALAQQALAVGLALGRPLPTERALQRAARRTKLPAVEALALLAKHRLGEDVRRELEALAANGELESRYALARQDAWGGRADAWDTLASEGLTRAIAARARWRADHGKADGARADLATLGDLLEDVPQDVPAGRELALTVRDLGWTRLLLKQEGAAPAARAAARGLPEDLDAALLLAEVDPKGGAEAAATAFLREANALGGALARGLFLGRLSRFRADPAFAALALPFLRARLSDCPALTPARPLLAEALAANGEQAQTLGGFESLALDWETLAPPVTVPVEVEPAVQQAITKLRQEGGQLRQDDKYAEAVAKVEEILVLAPRNKGALWDRGDWLSDPQPTEAGYMGLLRYARECPTWFLPILFHFYEDSLKGYLLMVEMPKETWAREGPLTHDQRGMRVMLQLLNLLYPAETRPVWVPPAERLSIPEILHQAGELLREDPGMAWLLSVTAHVHQLGDDIEAARRDLRLFLELIKGDTDVAGKPVAVVANLHRAWILGDSDPQLALDGLLEIPKEALSEKESNRVILWLESDPRLVKLRGLRGLAKFLSSIGEGKY